MKKIVLFILLCGFLTTSFAQKKSNYEKRAKASSNAIADQMDLTKDQKKLLYTSLVERQERNFSQIKGKDLTQKERSVIFEESHKIMVKKLSIKFTQNEILRVTKILRKQQEKKRETN